MNADASESSSAVRLFGLIQGSRVGDPITAMCSPQMWEENTAGSGGYILALSSGNLYLLPSTLNTSGTILCRSVKCAAPQRGSSDESLPDVVVCTTKGKILIYSYSVSSGGYINAASGSSTSMISEVNGMNEVPSGVVWWQGWIVLAGGRSSRSGSSYVAVSSVDGVVRELCPIDGPTNLTLIPEAHEVLLIGQDGLGIFISLPGLKEQSQGEVPHPAARNNIQYPQGVELCLLGRFIISASPLDGTVDIYSIWDQKLVQSLTLPEPVMALGASPAVVEDATVEDTDREKTCLSMLFGYGIWVGVWVGADTI
ncbi:hypothetical protein Pmar_PMAR011866 [Perkinsus marinus ATCC 50983]|uniref:Uncharacterized protein n=1 Tax=Perkinsus marinus (strain ATCC 50983 / TXsc) TaxID=423536 RepID=C5LBJ5_PERM5|nr:hypothetical protein Pmar_PMAR011866 [Perkinsus marinus ATCC 50983]EER05816.1 hypothetical protein Pmar_PMAR011866 [Perkinsus marinus ATCC 50983]|eukprot:XP_002774000.1 hypothetical protein Pmar_PMAR011866 [Perkinsus marinus ATCC 50983]